MEPRAIVQSVMLFVLAALCEIGGGWLIWKMVRAGKPVWWGLLGGVVLILYGLIPTLQAAHFGRTYAVYGGFFIAIALLWGWWIDGDVPDRLDWVGGAIALAGVCLMMYGRR